MNSSSGSSTVTITTGSSSLANSQHLSSSVSARSPSTRLSSEISKAYKNASQLFLTRRFPEALSVLEPAISPLRQPNYPKDNEEDLRAEAPIATSTRTQRIKVWVLYLTLLNEIVDLGQDEGKRCFGQKRYGEIVSHVRNGDIWETTVRDGYGGKEGSVDAEVVYNLSTLLLSQAPSQRLNQFRLESYLASSSRLDLDITQQLQRETSHRLQPDLRGAETPKDLSSHLKILELFTLHVLPRNEEWDYARSFISMSDMLDNQRRCSLLQCLQELQEVRENELQGEAASVIQEQDARLQEKLREESRTDAENAASQSHVVGQSGSLHRRTSSEVDYGIDKNRPTGNNVPRSKTQISATGSDTVSVGTTARSRYPPPADTSRNRNMRKPSHKEFPGYLPQAGNLFRVLQRVVWNMTTSIGANPSIILKVVLSVLAITIALSRRDMRERAKMILIHGWEKVRKTAGMGVKVSYI